MKKNKEKIIAIIIARGGSKSIPRKNVLPLHDKPLIAWSIELAKSIKKIDRIIVSSDDDEINNIAKKYNAEVLFKRPISLAEDNTPTLPVLQHCIKYLEDQENYKPDIILLLYPTSPFLKKERVEQALNLFKQKNCNSVLSVIKDLGHFWHKKDNSYRRLYPKNITNRQYCKPLYREDGAIYFSRYDVLMKKNNLVDEKNVQFIVMNKDENIDIDKPEDFHKARERK
ncbi:MAG: acylneuraminate cytidylyltransferase family protein [Patescibacteria group bacterium]|nr:acylneuraminate cytidylyltransferase family protein [Patescibacteria group bacterium]